MSDTITCPNCSATLPSAAAFCTTCGTRVAAAAAAPPPSSAPSTPPPMPGPATFEPPVDPTRVDGPAPGDPTQVIGGAAAPPPPGPTSAPWQPAEAAAAAAGWSAPQPPTVAAPAAYGAPAPAPTGQVPAWSPTSWEGAAPGAAPESASRSRAAGSPVGAGMAVLGGILTIVGIFLPWVTNNLTDSGLSGWDLTSGDKGFRLPDGALLPFKSLDPYVLLAIGVLAIVAGVLALQAKSRNLSRILGVVLGALVIGYMVRDWTSLADVVRTRAPASFEVSSAIGFYVTIAGGALVILSALMPSKTDKP